MESEREEQMIDGENLISLDDVLSNFPLILKEVDALKPLIERVQAFLFPQWEQLITRVRLEKARAAHLKHEVIKLNRQLGELEEKIEQLNAANEQLRKRAEMFRREAEKKLVKFDPDRHGVVCSESTRF